MAVVKLVKSIYTGVDVTALGELAAGDTVDLPSGSTIGGAAPITGNQTITVSGDASGSGSTAISLTLANSGVTAGTYTKLTVDAKGRVTVGASLASADLPTYTGSITSSQVTTALGYTPYNSSNPSGYITSSSLSSYLPLSGGTLTGALTAKAIRETAVAVAASAIDLSTGNFFTKTISGATTFTVSNVPATGTAASFILDLTNGGSATITWWSGMKWASGTAPTLTSAGRDVLGFFTHNGGSTWTGLVLAKDVK